jgi:hypothetical protein
MSTFPTEDHRLDLATLMLFQSFTGCRPAELVDASKSKACLNPLAELDETDLDECSLLDKMDEDDYEDIDKMDDDDYDSSSSKTDAASSSDDAHSSDTSELDEYGDPIRKYKSLCYEDICLWVVKNPKHGERDLLALEVYLRHHKGVDKKPKPYVATPIPSELKLTDTKAQPSCFGSNLAQSSVQLLIS